MKIFISGNPKTGKTSLIKKIVEYFGKDKFFGFYTEEVLENKERIGFRIVTTFDVKKFLARKDIRTNYRIGKYFVIKENIDEISKYTLENLEKNKNKIILIDEIGPMEFYSEYFKELTKKILNEDFNVLSVVHRNFLHIVPTYIWLDRKNWWDVYENIKKKIKDILYGKDSCK